MNNFGEYKTPQQIKTGGDRRSIKVLTELSKQDKKCICCDEKAWNYAGLDMCFSCTTGESDASDDIELIP